MSRAVEADDRASMDTSSNSSDGIQTKSSSNINNTKHENENGQAILAESKDNKKEPIVSNSEKQQVTAPTNDEQDAKPAVNNNSAPPNQQQAVTSTAEDISKYYKPELVARLNGFIALNEVRYEIIKSYVALNINLSYFLKIKNLNWSNQLFQRYAAFANVGIELKNYRSLVRVKDIKKTLIEQR